MEMNSKQYEQHTFISFLSKYHVVIPMVQRDYAQGRETDDVNRVRSRFLTAIKGHLKDGKTMTMDFVYGETENVWSRTEPGKLDSIVVTPLDGQQRLTTLYLLHWYAAKKAGLKHDDEEYKFLENFTYEIRPSSRDFCTQLLDFEPSPDSSLKEQLTDQYWFMGDWHNDPTILGMLVMLNAIEEEFADVENLWQLLTEKGKERIIFFFLPLSENGLSDELYIKMNSRGKKLTPFEHFKAEYEALYERDSDASRVINHKFDVEWADALFDYRDTNDDTTDKEFMRYFFYISHILCYKQGVPRSADEFELIKTLYQESPKAAENRQFLESALDCWYRVWYRVKKDPQFCSIDDFFSHYLSQFTHKEGKVTTYKTGEYGESQNFFRACIKLYQVNNNQFPLSDFLFLYGIILYLTHQKDISEPAFIERLRILRNLIWNSNAGEIRRNSMKDLLAEVSRLMLEGVIERERDGNGFNKIQEDEEIEKKARKAKMTPDELEWMYRYEDHPLIYGYVSGLGYNNLRLTDAFYSVFSPDCDYLQIHRALIAVGDYRQNGGNRYYMANQNRSTWERLLHPSSREGFERSMAVVRELLGRVQNGKSIEGITGSFTKGQEQKGEYTWRYYFAKYPDMLWGADGELVKEDFNNYKCTTLNKHQFNGRHWNSFLNVIYYQLAEDLGNVLSLDNRGGNLSLTSPVASIAPLNDGFMYFHGEAKEEWKVNQNGGVDTEDRIEMAINKIKAVVKEAREKDPPSSTDDKGITDKGGTVGTTL